MTLTLHRVATEPLIIATVRGPIATETFAALAAQTDALLAGIDAPLVYQIIDLCDATIDFPTLVQVAPTLVNGAPGALGDSRLRSMVVTTDKMNRLLVDMLRQPQFGDLMLPIFRTLADALAYVRVELYPPIPDAQQA